jgi:HK97 family phage major capsid protein
MDLSLKRKEALDAAEAVLQTAKAESRTALTDEERANYDAAMSQVKEIDTLRAMETTVNETKDSTLIGMSDKEIKRYSLLRAIRAAASQDWREAGFEKEANDATAKHLGRVPQGFFMPVDVVEHRDLTVGTPAAGGYTVATDLLAKSFIDLLRNKMVVQAAGATVLTGLVGDVAIPKLSAGATAYWVTEGNAPTESTHTFGQVTLAPKTVGAYSDLSRKLLIQSSIDVEALVRNDLALALALSLDLSALMGDGSSNTPTGVGYTSGIGDVAGGTHGGAPTWANIVELETDVAVSNADIGSLAYITNAKVRGKLKQVMTVATYGEIPLWVGSANGPGMLNGYPAYVTNQISSTLTKGNSSVASAILFGNWADLIVGLWSGIDILVDPYTASTTGTVRVVALQDADIAVRRAVSFSAMLDAVAA